MTTDASLQQAVLHKYGWTEVCRADCIYQQQLQADEIKTEIFSIQYFLY